MRILHIPTGQILKYYWSGNDNVILVPYEYERRISWEINKLKEHLSYQHFRKITTRKYDSLYIIDVLYNYETPILIKYDRKYSLTELELIS